MQPLLDRARDFMTSYEYEDRMKGTPVRDEQGTRDRPHDLRIKFDSAKIDAALADLALKPWGSDRPPVIAFVTVEYPASKYVLTSDGDQGLGQKQALVAAATRRGMAVSLPANAVAAPNVASGEPLLQGIMRWEPEGTFWRTECYGSMDLDGRPAIGADVGDAGNDLPSHPRDADHEEFVKVGREDGSELHPLQEGLGLLPHLFEHTPVEIEPAQLAVQVQVRLEGRQVPWALGTVSCGPNRYPG